MKQSIILSLFAFSLLFVSCQGSAQENRSNTAKVTNKVEVLDFYGTHRCVTCKAIEANARYTVNTYFADEQKKGLVVFSTINVDDEKNYEMAEKFAASGTALFLNVIKDGNETQIDLTDFAFSNGRDQEAFSQALKSKIEAQLKKL